MSSVVGKRGTDRNTKLGPNLELRRKFDPNSTQQSALNVLRPSQTDYECRIRRRSSTRPCDALTSPHLRRTFVGSLPAANCDIGGLATSEQTVAGHRILGGTIVVLQYCSVLANDPMFDEPNKFKPERFLNADGTGIDKVGNEPRMIC